MKSGMFVRLKAFRLQNTNANTIQRINFELSPRENDRTKNQSSGIHNTLDLVVFALNTYMYVGFVKFTFLFHIEYICIPISLSSMCNEIV